MAGYWSTAIGEIAEFMKALPKVVFSNTLAATDWSNTRLVRGSAADEVMCLKQGTGKDLFIFASTGLAGSLARAGLIDEFRIGLNPLAVDREAPVFEPSDEGMRLKFAEVRPLQSGIVLLRYACANSISGTPAGIARRSFRKG
jgi:dihydrofolate reductase